MTIDTLIFDMDGVITTEEKYWACARLTLWEVVTQTLGQKDAFGAAPHDAAIRESIAPDDMIYALKGRSVNSNWDIAYILVCTYLAALPDVTVLSAPTPEALIEAIRESLYALPVWPDAMAAFLNGTGGAKGRALIASAGTRLAEALQFEDAAMLRVEGPLWWYLHARFQRFYHGEAMTEHGAPPLADGTVIDAPQIEATLKTLRDEGYILGVATGRPRDELDDALGGLGLLAYFDSQRMGTLDVVRAAEAKLGISGLVKPHPYSLLRALYPRAETEVLLDESYWKLKRNNVVMIGDSTSDIVMAKEAGCHPVGVLTGVRGDAARSERHRLLLHSGCEAILDDVTHLPDWLDGQGSK